MWGFVTLWSSYHDLAHEGDLDEADGAASLEAHAVGQADVAVTAPSPAAQSEQVKTSQ